jgi:hypothetical protein
LPGSLRSQPACASGLTVTLICSGVAGVEGCVNELNASGTLSTMPMI